MLRSSLTSFLRALFLRSRMERDVDEELRFHLEARRDDLIAAGMNPDAATRRAREELRIPEAPAPSLPNYSDRRAVWAR